MTLRSLSGAIVLSSAALVQAGRTALPDMGLSVYVPTGWNLSILSASASDTESSRTYAMINEAAPDRAVFTFEATSGAGAMGDHSWSVLSGYAESLFIQGFPYSIVYLDDSIQQDGLFAWRVYGRYGEFDAQGLPMAVVDRYSRTFANGDIGWTIQFEGDTADVDTAGPTYATILDSVTVDRTFQSLPLKPRDHSRRGAFAASRVVGGRLAIEEIEMPVVRAVDAHGRSVAGDLVRGADGWIWSPKSPRPGLVLFRIQGPARDESLRAVLKP
ncbi:MAG TPA: hypothetical protein PKO15_01715 [Fibrobacteria bacterium]|nr:hypothetical protein [Fibrobacteria bacterium]HOX49850.1 hypothetical protein [Fibrobacteria bacterium]